MMATRTILCFGDSLTWGFVPVAPAAPARRFPRDVRWTGVLAAELGDGYAVVEEGLNGRTTSADDPTDARLNASTYLPTALASHLPLDLVVLMLGTNDSKAYLRRTPLDIATGMRLLVAQVLACGDARSAYPAPRLLVVAPPPLTEIRDPWSAAVFAGGHEKTAQLGGLYRALAGATGVDFFDAGSVITTDGVDGVHFTEQNNLDLGRALAPQVRTLLT
jgi:lysophospholipase L1-like esterase